MPYGVVVVDDEYWIRTLIRSFIPKNDETLTFQDDAADGLEGLILCRKLKPEILITDLKMPGMGGFEMLETVKQEFPDMQIIIISGYEEFEDARRAVSNGVLDYLLKPVEKNAFVDILHKAVRNLDQINENKREIQSLRERVHNLDNIFAASSEASMIRDERIKRSVQYIQENYMRDISLDDAASEAAMTPNYFSECFKKHTGSRFSDFLIFCRLHHAAQLLLDPSLRISDVARQSGFRDPNYFTKTFKRMTGRKPGECRIKK